VVAQREAARQRREASDSFCGLFNAAVSAVILSIYLGSAIPKRAKGTVFLDSWVLQTSRAFLAVRIFEDLSTT
jgi:hypothetical protein